MKINSPVSYSVWYICFRYFVYLLVLGATLFVDVACFYSNIRTLIPLSFCVYACALIYAPTLLVFITFVSIACLPTVIPVSWVLCMISVSCMTLIGLCCRSLLLIVWPVPYCLVMCYVLMQYVIGYLYPCVPIIMTRLTIGSFLVILVVIKYLSLIVSTHPRQGNRV